MLLYLIYVSMCAFCVMISNIHSFYCICNFIIFFVLFFTIRILIYIVLMNLNSKNGAIDGKFSNSTLDNSERGCMLPTLV